MRPQWISGHKPMKKLSLFLILACFCVPLCALTLPEKPEARVNDYAGFLSVSMKKILENMLEEHEKETSNQIAVATFPSLDGNSLEDVSWRLASQWKLGQKDKNNGVLLIVFREERQLRIEVGYGLEASLTDARCRMIIENDIKPFFKSGNYEKGFYSGLEAIIAVIKNEYKARPKPSSDTSLLPFIFFFVLFLFFILAPKSQTSYRGSGWTRSSHSSSSPVRFRSSFSGGGGRFGGGGASGSW